MIRHTVLFRFREPDDAIIARELLDDLAGRITGLISLWTGEGAAPSTDTHQLILITEHPDWEALDAYQRHPRHQKALAVIKPALTDRAAIDVEL